MERYTLEKTFVTFFSSIIGVLAVCAIGMILFIIYDSAPTSLYVICGLLVLWFICFLWVWYKGKE